MEERLIKIEESVRLLVNGQFQLRKNYERYFKKMMEGFRAIERAFRMNCVAQIDMSEILDDYCSTVPGDSVKVV